MGFLPCTFEICKLFFSFYSIYRHHRIFVKSFFFQFCFHSQIKIWWIIYDSSMISVNSTWMYYLYFWIFLIKCRKNREKCFSSGERAGTHSVTFSINQIVFQCFRQLELFLSSVSRVFPKIEFFLSTRSSMHITTTQNRLFWYFDSKHYYANKWSGRPGNHINIILMVPLSIYTCLQLKYFMKTNYSTI